MTITATQLKLRVVSGKIVYTAWAVEVGDKYYYQIGKTFSNREVGIRPCSEKSKPILLFNRSKITRSD